MCRSFLLFLSTFLFGSFAFAEIRFTNIQSDGRPVIAIDVFRFTDTGRLELNVSQVNLCNKNPNLDLAKLGFFICREAAWDHVLQQLVEGEVTCALDSDLVKLVFNFRSLNGKSSFDADFRVDNANRYTLALANCLDGGKVSMNVRSAMYNLEGTPRRSKSPQEYKSHIKRTGRAHGWDVPFYIFNFFKGITLPVLTISIGTCWSQLKPYLQDKVNKILRIVIPLQVAANTARVILVETPSFDSSRFAWKIGFVVVDIVCYFPMFSPIADSIENLREAAPTDGNAAVNLMKLTLLIQYYLVVIGYTFFLRALILPLVTIGSYENGHPWTSVLAEELATVALYAFTGYKFMPEAHSQYSKIDDEEKDAGAEQLKLEDRDGQNGE
ncbi:hypothetical protein V6N13_070399 [Hibiscus sabdariffa]